MERAEPTQTFFYLIPCNRQEALHSALFNYTPLVISDDRKKYAANEPTQTGIYWKKYVNGSVNSEGHINK
jgi:hypothetical protein